MKRRSTLVLLICLISGFIFLMGNTGDHPDSQTLKLLSYQDLIESAFIQKHLQILASDSMEGRETGMPGQKKAARYLASQYADLSLLPAGDNNSFYQRYELSGYQYDSTVYITYSGKSSEVLDRSVSSAFGASEYSWVYGRSDSMDAEIVFAGFGIQDSEHGIDHLKDIDLSGKWVLIFNEIPYTKNGDTIVNPSINSRGRFYSLRSRKAAGLLLITLDTEEEYKNTAGTRLARYAKPLDLSLSYLNREPRGFKGFNQMSPAQAAVVLGLNQGHDYLNQFRDSLISNITTFKPYKTGIRLKQIPFTRKTVVESENIVALVEGSDPVLKEEVIILSAHYDHVGIGRPDSTGDAIYNGADDNASGTVGLLSIAKAFSEAGKKGIKPARSIIFLSVSGEEKGLLGSRFYSDHPAFPIEKTIANINVDMIGRIDNKHSQEKIDNYSYIIGGELISSGLDSILRVANQRSGQILFDNRYNSVYDPNQFYRRSDHWNFGRLGIPFIFFFTGVHEDYHQPSDEADKINYHKMAEITRTIYATTVLLSNTPSPPDVDNQTFIEATEVSPR